MQVGLQLTAAAAQTLDPREDILVLEQLGRLDLDGLKHRAAWSTITKPRLHLRQPLRAQLKNRRAFGLPRQEAVELIGRLFQRALRCDDTRIIGLEPEPSFTRRREEALQ